MEETLYQMVKNLPANHPARKEYVDLYIASEKMNLLECGGVDNWEGYGDALYPDKKLMGDGFKDIDEIEEEIRKEMLT